MTSKHPLTECFVYITLPGQTGAVTAGRFELRPDIPLGRFVYGRSYMERKDAVELDPVELKLATRTYETTALNGVFGALRDAGPDYWGRRVIDRHIQKSPLSEMDYLLHSSDDRAGSLGFGMGQKPPAPRREFNKALDLTKLQEIADIIVRDEILPVDATTAQVEELMLIGTSMGGARPKAVVEDKDGLWIAKFNRTDDKWNNAKVEHTMLVLARACGITTAESKVVSAGKRDVLLVKRFDRDKAKDGYLRSRMISGLTLLRAEDSHRSRDKWSYIFLVEELRRVSVQAKQDATELFRRMCFNALISNTDDHPRNHALIAKDKDWKLSPAYDLTPTSPVSLERRDLALICGDQGRYASARNLVSQSNRFLIEREAAEKIIFDMENHIQTLWYKTLRAEGVTEHDCEKIKGAFAYPGFRLNV